MAICQMAIGCMTMDAREGKSRKERQPIATLLPITHSIAIATDHDGLAIDNAIAACFSGTRQGGTPKECTGNGKRNGKTVETLECLIHGIL